jgi:hypothetical protein
MLMVAYGMMAAGFGLCIVELLRGVDRPTFGATAAWFAAGVVLIVVGGAIRNHS